MRGLQVGVILAASLRHDIHGFVVSTAKVAGVAVLALLVLIIIHRFFVAMRRVFIYSGSLAMIVGVIVLAFGIYSGRDDSKRWGIGFVLGGIVVCLVGQFLNERYSRR